MECELGREAEFVEEGGHHLGIVLCRLPINISTQCLDARSSPGGMNLLNHGATSTPGDVEDLAKMAKEAVQSSSPIDETTIC